jgi:hypothetical protein
MAQAGLKWYFTIPDIKMFDDCRNPLKRDSEVQNLVVGLRK